MSEIIYVINFIVVDTWYLKLDFIAVKALFELILDELLIYLILNLKVVEVEVILSILLYLKIHELVQVFFVLVVVDCVILRHSY